MGGDIVLYYNYLESIPEQSITFQNVNSIGPDISPFKQYITRTKVSLPESKASGIFMRTLLMVAKLEMTWAPNSRNTFE